jgi:D-alanyl-lipoteichoic acid acyltransferase DltB (MBOAT superfamily)
MTNTNPSDNYWENQGFHLKFNEKLKDWIRTSIVSLILVLLFYLIFSRTSQDQASATLSTQFPTNNQCKNMLSSYADMQNGIEILTVEAAR